MFNALQYAMPHFMQGMGQQGQWWQNQQANRPDMGYGQQQMPWWMHQGQQQPQMQQPPMGMPMPGYNDPQGGKMGFPMRGITPRPSPPMMQGNALSMWQQAR